MNRFFEIFNRGQKFLGHRMRRCDRCGAFYDPQIGHMDLNCEVVRRTNR